MVKTTNKSDVSWYNETNAEPLYLKCDCYSEGIEFQYYNEDTHDKGFYVNYWKYGINGRYSVVSLWDRIRFAWKLLINGTLHGDQIVLSVEKAKTIKNYLEEYITYDESVEKN